MAIKRPQGVATKHAKYDAMVYKWERCRDVIAGQDAVHEAGQAYLPKLREQPIDRYRAMVARASFYNATWRTIAGLSGMVFRKPPTIEAPAAMKPLIDDVTASGQSLENLAVHVTIEALSVGRIGLLVDFPKAKTDGSTSQADAARFGLRPSIAVYLTESIINWRKVRINNRTVLGLVVLQETRCKPADDGFGDIEQTWYRALDLVNLGTDVAPSFQYRQREYTANERGQTTQVGPDQFPKMNGKPLDFIPFIPIGTDGLEIEPDEPPLIDLVDMNLSHYRTTADYEHGCHFAALPTPWITGHKKQSPTESWPIGGEAAWILPNENAKVGMLEFNGAGMGALEKNLAAKEQRMAVLGARMLEQMKRAVESADTASIHRVGEQSMLSRVAQMISAGLTQALDWLGQFAQQPPNAATIDLNRDFYPAPMDPPRILALMQAYQGGVLSYDTLWSAFQIADVVDVNTTAEQERAKIDADPPPLMALRPPVDIGGPAGPGVRADLTAA